MVQRGAWCGSDSTVSLLANYSKRRSTFEYLAGASQGIMRPGYGRTTHFFQLYHRSGRGRPKLIKHISSSRALSTTRHNGIFCGLSHGGVKGQRMRWCPCQLSRRRGRQERSVCVAVTGTTVHIYSSRPSSVQGSSFTDVMRNCYLILRKTRPSNVRCNIALPRDILNIQKPARDLYTTAVCGDHTILGWFFLR